MIRIYFAGPLFTPYEREFISSCAARLRAEGFEVFVPHEQPEKRTPEEKLRYQRLDEREKAVAVYETDYAGLKWANVVVALLDGPQVDDGTASEIGVFAQMIAEHPAEKKAILGLATDMRIASRDARGEGKGLNYFTVGAIYKYGDVYTSLEDVVAALRRIEAGSRE